MATWSRSGEGERLWFLGTLATIRIAGEAVEGRFALIEFLFPQHASPPLHTHPQDESYVVLEGRLTVQAGDRRFAAAIPYASIIVELDEAKGALLAGNLLDAPYTEAKVGRRVEVVFEKLNDDITLPQFRLAQDEVSSQRR